MNLNEFEELKGFIPCPFCGKKALVKWDAHGQASHPCKCGQYLLFDYDAMTAEPTKPMRGAVKRFMDRSNNTDHRLSR